MPTDLTSSRRGRRTTAVSSVCESESCEVASSTTESRSRVRSSSRRSSPARSSARRAWPARVTNDAIVPSELSCGTADDRNTSWSTPIGGWPTQEGGDRRVVEVVEPGDSRLEHCLGERPDGALVRYSGTGEHLEPLDRTPPDHASDRTGCVGRKPRDPLGAPQLVAARRQGLRGQHQCRAGQPRGSVGIRAQDEGRLARGDSRSVPLGGAERAARAVELEQCADLAIEPDRDEERGSRAGPLRDPPEAR